MKKALTYPLKLIAENAGTNGSVVMQKVIDSQDPNYGYNAAIDKFEDLMQSGIIDPTKVRAAGHRNVHYATHYTVTGGQGGAGGGAGLDQRRRVGVGGWGHYSDCYHPALGSGAD